MTHTLHFSERKTSSCALVIKDCYYRHCHSHDFCTPGIVVLCSDHKFMDVSEEKINIKIEITIFFKNQSEINQK